ncbi:MULTISPECIES: DUF2281 domain-containing protein [Saccharibacillus]|uniref:DUF2281 domain-containing protein n=1 Tax=Saccharibacillus brassicae TaxID=2583377 RepID=A0A4Y6UTH4_SACBS|nr:MULTISPECIES: DUF2281 domain-containing protein [Saccharibacillus]MWJ31372.1 DUF2281 domain-containing protein [Saccharibacillus sp. WB 17]QDH20374.1 DUF2281 domain-containing protein [Saccharibacillus brassicae]
MSLEQKLINDFLSLPQEKQMEVIDFVEFLKTKSTPQTESIMDDIINENLEALKELAK